MPTYDEWFGEQTEEVKAMIEEHNKGLHNSVKATRDERDALSKELKKLAKEVDENSEAGKQLGELRSKLEFAERKSNFIEEAVKNGAKRPSAAFAIASTENLFLEDGTADWKKIKESIPELFSVTNTNTNAGSGTNTALPKNDVNQRFREAANKQIK
jgi:hypothetical protein